MTRYGRRTSALVAAAILAALTLAGCGSAKRTFGLEKEAPDEFVVVQRAPLVLRKQPLGERGQPVMGAHLQPIQVAHEARELLGPALPVPILLGKGIAKTAHSEAAQKGPFDPLAGTALQNRQ